MMESFSEGYKLYVENHQVQAWFTDILKLWIFWLLTIPTHALFKCLKDLNIQQLLETPWKGSQ